MERPRAFELSRYYSAETGEFNFGALQNDASALGIEASSNNSSEKRVWRTVEAIWNGKMVQGRVDKTKDVLGFFAETTESFRKEKEAGRKINELLINGRTGEIFVQIFPPNKDLGYDEGRMRIGIKKKKLGIDVLLTYGIPLVNVSPEECMHQFWRLEEFDSKPTGDIREPEDLRDKIVTFVPPGSENWIDFLSKQINDGFVPKKVWDVVKNGDVPREARKLRRKTEAVLVSQRSRILEAAERGNWDGLVYAGARIEQEMVALGYNIASGACGILNMDILRDKEISKLLDKGEAIIVIDQNGNISKVVTEKWDYHMDHCRICDPEKKKEKTLCGPCIICKVCEKKFSAN